MFSTKSFTLTIFFMTTSTNHMCSLEDCQGFIAKCKFAQVIHRVIQTQVVSCHQKLYQFQSVKLTDLGVVWY